MSDFSPATGQKPVLSSLTCLILLSLASCARAEPPEQFVPDSTMLDDQSASLPTQGQSQGYDYQIVQGLAVLQGDILLGPVDSDGQLVRDFQNRGVGRNDVFGRWPDGIVPYRLPAESLSIQRTRVQQAIEHWTENTRMSFVEVTDANESLYPNHITFVDSEGCASYVGRIGGAQPIMLSQNCSVGSVIHEIGHAIGLYHEHTRADRDSFVTIDFSQIESGRENNFAILNSSQLDFESYSPYDYGSIMHYGEFFFSDSSSPTIIVPDGEEIGQRVALSDYDALSANNMYATDLAANVLTTETTDNGVEIVVSITNQGSLGAHNVEFLIRVGDDSQWLGVSPDSGWECVTFEAELNCTRDTIRENTESRFTLLVDPASSSIEDDLSYAVSSRTLDSDTDNNTFNDSSIVWQSQSNQAEMGNSENLNTDINLPPGLAAANTSSDDSGSGSMHFGILAILLAAAGFRRRQ